MSRKLLLLLCLVVFGAGFPAHADAPIVRSTKPLKNRYLVRFKNDVSPAQVDDLAKALAHQHGGRLLATMKFAMRGFGVELNEQAAESLGRNPLIALIEEDQLLELASGRPDIHQLDAAVHLQGNDASGEPDHDVSDELQLEQRWLLRLQLQR